MVCPPPPSPVLSPFRSTGPLWGCGGAPPPPRRPKDLQSPCPSPQIPVRPPGPRPLGGGGGWPCSRFAQRQWKGRGRCPPRGWQQGRDQPTAHGTFHVVRRCEIVVRGGRRVGQEGVRDRGTQERQQTGEGATQTHRTWEPHQEGQGQAQQTSRRGTARQERQPEQRERGTRMEGMGERAHGRQRQ